MDWKDAVHGFELDEQTLLDDEIGAVRTVDGRIEILERNRHLTLETDASVTKLGGEALLVGSLEESRSEPAMHLDHCADSSFREVPEIISAHDGLSAQGRERLRTIFEEAA